MVVRRFMNKSGVLKVFLIGTRRYAYRLNFRRAKVPEWVITAMNSIGEKSIGFEEETKETEDPGTLIESGPDPEDPIGAQEHGEDDWGDIPEHVGEDDIDEVNEAIRVLEEADIQANFEEEPHDGEVNTRSRIDRNAFNNEVEADRYAEYVAMGC